MRMVSKTGLEAIRSRLLNFSKNNNALVITGSIIVGVSLLSVIYFGSITIKDASTGNIGGANSLPKTSFGLFSAYHLEYTSFFIFLFGATLLTFGVFGKSGSSREHNVSKV